MIGATYQERPELYKQASPMSYIDPERSAVSADPRRAGPHGVGGAIQVMEAALKAAGVPVTLLLVNNADHMLVKRGGKCSALIAVWTGRSWSS